MTYCGKPSTLVQAGRWLLGDWLGCSDASPAHPTRVRWDRGLGARWPIHGFDSSLLKAISHDDCPMGTCIVIHYCKIGPNSKEKWINIWVNDLVNITLSCQGLIDNHFIHFKVVRDAHLHHYGSTTVWVILNNFAICKSLIFTSPNACPAVCP